MSPDYIAYSRNPLSYWVLSCGALLFPVLTLFSLDGAFDAPFMHHWFWILFSFGFALPVAGLGIRAVSLRTPLIFCCGDEIYLEDAMLPWRNARIPRKAVISLSATDTMNDDSPAEIWFELTSEGYNKAHTSRIWSNRDPDRNLLSYPFQNATATPTVAATEIGDWICAEAQKERLSC
jgi:hypothetical protein